MNRKGFIDLLLVATIGFGLAIGYFAPLLFSSDNQSAGQSLGASVLFPYQGGTGSSTIPQSGQILIANDTLVYAPANLTAGSNITITTSSGGITIGAAASTFSTSTAHVWGALQTFANGIAFNTATGTSATSTISANSANFNELRVNSSTVQTTLVVNGSVTGNMVVTAGVHSNTLNVTSTSVFGSTISGTSGIFTGQVSVNTLNVTSTSVFGSSIQGTSAVFTGLVAVSTLNVTSTSNFAALATFDSINVTNANEYRKHTATIIVMNPSVINHATGTVFFVFPVDATLLSLRCHSRPSGTSTIAVDRRSSSTPATAGQAVVASQECGSSASTISFTSSTVPAGQGLNFTFNPVAGSPSSTVIYVDYLNND